MDQLSIIWSIDIEPYVGNWWVDLTADMPRLNITRRDNQATNHILILPFVVTTDQRSPPGFQERSEL